jgi:hypothetical protein
VKAAAFLTTRLVFASFQLLTSLYCLLAYLPFTYHQVHTGGLLPWLDGFARIHPWLNLAALALVLPWLVEPWQRGGLARWLAAGLGIGQLALGSGLALHPVLSNLQNNSASLMWSLLALAPLAWLATIDIVAHAGQVKPITEHLTSPRGAGRFSFRCCTQESSCSAGQPACARLRKRPPWGGVCWHTSCCF